MGEQNRFILLYRGVDNIYKAIASVEAAYALLILALVAVSSQNPSLIHTLLGNKVLLAAMLLAPLAPTLYLLRRGFTTLRGYNPRRYRIPALGATLALAAFAAGATGILMLLSTRHPSRLAGALIGVAIAGGVPAALMILAGLWALGKEPGGDVLRKGLIMWLVGLLLAPLGVGALIAVGGAALVLIGLRRLRRHAWLLVRSGEQERVVGPGGFEPPTTRL